MISKSDITDRMRQAMHREPALRQPGAQRPAEEHGPHARTKRALPKLPNENNPHAQLPNPKPKRHQATALDGAIQGEAEGTQRTVVKFIGYRVRPLDPDNFSGGVKDLLDGLRHAGLLRGDEPWRIKLETEQVKVSTFKEEKTVIEITYP